MVLGPGIKVSATRRTPEIQLKDVFLRAVAGLDEDDSRGAVVADALSHLQRGFESHYAGGAKDDDILLGDNSYAWAVETIARLDEPEFVGVASRMIRDGAECISSGGAVTLETWTPHLAELLEIISREERERSRRRILESAREVRGEPGD